MLTGCFFCLCLYIIVKRILIQFIKGGISMTFCCKAYAYLSPVISLCREIYFCSSSASDISAKLFRIAFLVSGLTWESIKVRRFDTPPFFITFAAIIKSCLQEVNIFVFKSFCYFKSSNFFHFLSLSFY